MVYKLEDLLQQVSSLLLHSYIAAISYYQANHFNANIKINGINVSGLTADQALKQIKYICFKKRSLCRTPTNFRWKRYKDGIYG